MGWVNMLIEPILMIFIAVGVMGFLLSLYIPMFRMAEQFSFKSQFLPTVF